MSENGAPRPIFIPTSGIVLLSISTISITLRFIGQLSRRTGKLNIGDLFISIGWICAAALTSIAVYASLTRNLSNHIAHVSGLEDQKTVAIYAVVIDGLYFFGVSCVKFSIFLWYYDLIAERGAEYGGLRSVTRVLAALTALSGVVYLVIPFIGCKPFEALWRQVDPTYLTPYKCIDFFLEALITAVFESITDVSACIIPLIIISQQTTPFRYKTGVAIILMLGVVVTVAGAVRVWQVRALYQNDDDWTWSRALINLISIFRIHLAIICACSPFAYRDVQPFLGHIKLKLQFNRNNRLHATKRLDNMDNPSYWSLRSKSPLPPQVKSSLSRARGSSVVEKLRKKPFAQEIGDLEAGTFIEKKAGKRKASPTPLNLANPPPVPRKRSPDQHSQCEITVVYTPSLRVPPKTHIADMQSPTLPPDFLIQRNRPSDMSWRTSKSKPSTCSSARSTTSTITSLTPQLKRTQSSNTTISQILSAPYSPGLSTIDLGELPDIHALPEMPEMPALRSARLPCPVCGKFHPVGYRHTEAEGGRNSSKFALWRSSVTTTRHSQSTFYHEDDEDDESVLRRGAFRAHLGTKE